MSAIQVVHGICSITVITASCVMGTLPTLTEAPFIRAADSPDGFAYEAHGQRLTWRRLLDDALRAASAMAAYGVGRASRCALVLPTGLDFVSAYYGAQLLGAVARSSAGGLANLAPWVTSTASIAAG